MLWVAYDDEGLPIGVLDTHIELQEFIGVSTATLYRMLDNGDPRIARIRDFYDEDEEDITEDI